MLIVRAFRVLAAAVLVIGGVTVSSESASAAAPILFRISPTSFDFGDVGVGSTSPGQRVTITNVSGGPVVMSGAGGAAGVFGGVQDCQGRTLAPGASCHMTYAFTPIARGVTHGSTAGSWNGQHFSFTFVGNGIDRFRISPTALSFGATPVGGHSATQRITITNTSRTAAVMSGAGGAAGVFGGTQNCQGLTLAPGASCHMYYRFSPTTPGRVAESTSGSWNGQPFAFHFTGNGDGTPEVRITPTALDFDAVPRGQPSPQQAIAITNRTSAAIPTDPTGIAAPRFGGTTDCGPSLAAGATCHFFYAFTPSTVGTASATAQGTIAGREFHLTFSGLGVRRFLISPVGFDFGAIPAGAISRQQSVSIHNVSAAPAPIHLSGFNVAGFDRTTTCDSTLAAHAACAMTYRFHPSAPGHVVADATAAVSGQQALLHLTGTGT